MVPGSQNIVELDAYFVENRALMLSKQQFMPRFQIVGIIGAMHRTNEVTVMRRGIELLFAKLPQQFMNLESPGGGVSTQQRLTDQRQQRFYRRTGDLLRPFAYEATSEYGKSREDVVFFISQQLP